VKNTLSELLDDLTEQNQQIIDFGGGLGGTYICNSDVLLKKNLNYIVIEQQNFVHEGNVLTREFSIPIKFSSELPKLEFNCIVILSGVIQYLQHWERIIELITSQQPRYIIVDRTPLEEKESKFFVQENTGYYEPNVSYPCIHLNRQEFLGSFQNYRLILEWKSDFDPKNHRGFLFERGRSA
jgi:putative methyltransferase (TIGR04325 family)